MNGGRGHLSRAIGMAAFLVVGGVSAAASARTLRVPEDHRTIQAAIDAAGAGDEVVVAAGRHCGAEIHRPVRLRAAGWGQTKIVGCDGGPTLFGQLRVGFLLVGTPEAGPARGTRIEGFSFDGAGVSNDNLSPLAFGIYARFTDDVQVSGNRFEGTVQAITNTAGDGWNIRSNRIVDLTLFGCPGHCGGGAGIVVQAATGDGASPGGIEDPANRPERTLILHNQVAGQAPAGFTEFPMAGILVVAADATLVFNNDVAVRPGDGAGADHPLAAGITFTDRCCGRPPLSSGTRLSAVVLNDGSNSQYSVIVEGDGGANTSGLLVGANRGETLLEGALAAP